MIGLNLNIVWFALVGVLLAGYAILDGFDLGVGSLHLLTKKDQDRRVFLNAIGPVWDGNEVWLVTGGGALFAAFPHVYATVFSGFYTAFMLLLFVLIFRAVSIEFRSKRESVKWRSAWDVAFSISSIIIPLLMGVALGNIIAGIPLDSNHEAFLNLLHLLNPYSLLVGITTVALFMMHGAIFLMVKTEGELQDTVKRWVNNTFIFFVICYLVVTVVTFIFVPHITENFRNYPVLFIIALLNLLSIANIKREMHFKKYFRAFLSSSVNISLLLVIFAVGMFPNLVLSIPNPENSLNIYNASSSERTLYTMFIIALIGFPLVIAYTASIYWVFRGKVKMDATSY